MFFLKEPCSCFSFCTTIPIILFWFNDSNHERRKLPLTFKVKIAKRFHVRKFKLCSQGKFEVLKYISCLLTQNIDIFVSVGLVGDQVPALILPPILPSDPLNDHLASENTPLTIWHQSILKQSIMYMMKAFENKLHHKRLNKLNSGLFMC